MILHLCEHLDVPLRQRNEILLAGGYAPRYARRSYHDDAELRHAVDRIVNSHPYPAVVVDGDWNLVTANAHSAIFLDGVDATLLEPPINVVELSLNPDGLARRVRNFDQYAAHLVARLRRTVAHSPTPTLERLLRSYVHLAARHEPDRDSLVLPLELDTPGGVVRMFSTITTFGAPRDVTLEELAIETFYPTDEESE